MKATDASPVPADAPQPDKATALRFLRALFFREPGAIGYLQIFSLPGSKPHFFDASRAGHLHFAAAYAASEARSKNSYFGVGLQGQKPAKGRRGGESTVISIPGVWLDLDVRGPAHKAHNLPPTVDDAMTIIHALGLKPSIIVHSGHGLHVYWLFHQVWHLGDEAQRRDAKALVSRFQAGLRRLAQTRGWTIDNTADLARILRIPGTLNRKNPSEIKFVSFEDFEPRYSVSDIAKVVEDIPKRQPQPKPEPTRDPEDFPPAKLAPIVEGCAWIRHCKDDAGQLLEPEWYAALSVVGRCEDGEAAAHEWSRPYPNYTESETQRKLSHALKDTGPITCEYVSNSLGQSEFCSECPQWGKIKSPINLGTPTNSGGLIQVEESWPTPKPLLAPLPSVPEFDPELLPPALRDQVMDIAERLQVPADFPAATAIGALAGATGRRAIIAPKRPRSVPESWPTPREDLASSDAFLDRYGVRRLFSRQK